MRREAPPCGGPTVLLAAWVIVVIIVLVYVKPAQEESPENATTRRLSIEDQILIRESARQAVEWRRRREEAMHSACAPGTFIVVTPTMSWRCDTMEVFGG